MLHTRTRRSSFMIVLLSLLTLLITGSTYSVAATGKKSDSTPPPRLLRTKQYASDHLIVKYKDGVTKNEQQKVHEQIGATQRHRFHKSGAVLLQLKDGETVDDVIEEMRKDPNVASVQRDHYLSIQQNFPDDPDFESCWGLHNTNQYLLGKEDADIDAPEAWTITTGSHSVIVAVIDTGVEYTHEDLADNMWVNTAEEYGITGVDDDGNGYVDDIHGISVIGGAVTSDPMDDHGHGTHCAGILGAVGNNSTGITGVNWNVSIMALKFLDESGWGLESDAAICLEYAVDNGAQITSNSYGGPDDVQALYDAISYANDNGVLFCTSAGNSSEDLDLLPSYPAVYDIPNIIAIAATDYGDYLAWFSNYGAQSVHVAAPGEVISSTWLGSEYKDLDGTSMACPFVAGIAALVKANEPDISLSDLWGRVVWTGDSLFELQETTITGLRVNAYNALAGIYNVRILSQSPLPDATVAEPYSFEFEVKGFAPPYTWEWDAPEYVEKEVENRFTYDGTAMGWNQDEGMWSYALPFSFPFFGNSYTNVYVCSNGYLEFSDTPPTPDGDADRDRLRDKKMIAPYWSDLNTNSSYYATDIYVWQPDADSIAFRWKATELEWLFPMEPLNFSVVLYSDGRIEMNYGASEGSLIGPVVGVSNGDEINYRLSYAKTGQSSLAWAPTTLFTSGEIPPGLSLDPDTGVLSGTPTAAGDYVFDVTASDTSGGSSTRQFAMKVHPENGPWPAFTGTPLRGVETLEVNFTDASTSEATITNWMWNFGDGTTSTLQNPTHTYDGVGHYAVSLTVQDETGTTNSLIKTAYVHVFASGPVASFTASPTTGEAPLSVTFTDASQPISDDVLDSLYTWRWDFGDGVVETRYVPDSFEYVYDEAGIYTVTLEVQDLWERAGIQTRESYIFVGVATDYDLTWNTTGAGSGTVTLTPPGVTSASGTETYTYGSAVDLTANPASGSHFTNWIGDVDDGLALSTSIFMDGNETVTAVFGSGDPGDIMGAKWHDLDGDGIWDAGESGIGGWRIFLDDDGDGEWDAEERSVLTENDGSYTFTDLPPGSYTVTEESLPGWQQTAPSDPGIYALTLDPGATVSGLDFGNQFIGSPPNEPTNPFPAHNATNISFNQTLSWELDAASSADYEENFDDGLAQGWIEDTDAQWEIVSGEYRAYSDDVEADMSATYTAQTWDDLTYEATVRRTGDSYPSSALIFRATSDFVLYESGSAYIVAINSLGQFLVGEQVDGSANAFPTALWVSTTNLNSGNATNTIKVIMTGTNMSVYFNDVLTWSGSDSSLTDPGRIGFYAAAGDTTTTTHYFDNVKVYSGTESESVTSDAPSSVSTQATSLTFDLYFGTDATPTTLLASDLTETTYDPTAGGDDLLPSTTYYWEVIAKNPVGESSSEIWSFTTQSEETSGTIRGFKWNDLNGDGTQNTNESGLEGWTIFIDTNQNGAYDDGEPTAVTDSTGAYEFTGLAAGDYLLGEIDQIGWRQTYPSSGVSSTVVEAPRSTPSPDEITREIMNSPPTPPSGANIESTTVTAIAETAVTLSEVPTSTWTYGCSATSAGMLFGYYDRTGYANMYTGSTNGGVCPLTNLGQGINTPISGACSIIATQNGFDDRETAGHVDDYWVSTNSTGPDPWETEGTEHTWADCTADFMGTNQWKWNYDVNPPAIDSVVDGATSLWHYNSNAKLYDFTPSATYGLPQTALCHGLRLFAESRGYTVVENYTQMIDTEYTGGFSYENYQAEIDAERPILIQVEGHTMVGVGYDTASETIYLHDTWDNSTHSMTWGGSYYGMAHYAVTAIELAPITYPGMHTVSLETGGLVEDVNFGNRWITHSLTIAAAPTSAGGTLPLPGTYTYDLDEVVDIQAIPASGYRFDHWEGNVADANAAETTVTMDADQTVTAYFVKTYTLTMAASPTAGGTISPTAGTYTYDEGDVVTVIATANTGYRFDHWEGDVADTSAAETTVTMDADQTVTAYFVKTYTLTMAASPTAGGTTTPAVGTHTYDDGDVVTVTAIANTGYRFDHWEGDVGDTSTAETTVTMDADQTVTAYFVKTYTLTMVASPTAGGTSTPAVGTHTYDDGDVVTVTAIANTGYRFDHWDGAVADTSTAETTVTMDADQTVTAYFVKTYTLTMAASPTAGGTISPTAGTYTYDEGDVVTVTATANTGYRFDHWEGDVGDTGAAETTVTMDADQTVTAVFEAEVSAPLYRFDFGTTSSPVETDYTGITHGTSYSGSTGYGWVAGTVSSRDRSTSDALTRDFNFTGDATFGVDLMPGDYDITITLGDASYPHDQMAIYLENAYVDSVTTSAGIFATNTYPVTVTDGQLTVRLKDMGGSDGNVVIVAMEIVSTGTPPDALTVNISADTIDETDGVSATTATVTRNGDTADALEVALVSSDTTEAIVPETVTIPAGESSVDFDIDAVDDAELDGTQTVTITASATDYFDGTDTLDVTDDEAPAVPEDRYDFGTASSPLATDYLRVSADTVYSMTQGYGWLEGTVVARDRAIGDDLTRDFNFTDDATFVVDVAGGTYEVTVTLGDATSPHDRMGIFLEGVQVDEVTTAANVFATNTYTTDVTDGQLTVRLQDMGGSDGNVTIAALETVCIGLPAAALTVEITADSIAENAGSAATTGRVTRSGDTTSALEVTLQSSNISEATVPATVTILAGESYADFDIDAVDDTESDGTQTVMITASASGYANGSDTVEVTDNEAAAEPVGQYDFGTTSSPVATDYTRVSESTTYSAAQGYGWLLGTIRSRDRSMGDDLTRDFCFTGDATFVMDLAAGDYEVVVTLGDATTTHDRMGVFLEDIQVGEVTTAANAFATNTYTTNVSDGQLTVRLADMGGSDGNVTITNLEIYPLGPAPDGLTVTISPSSISEDAGALAATGRVTRNGDTTESLEVTLVSNDISEATVPATVTILAGESYADFDIDAVDDTELDGTQTVTITASATDYADGSETLDVTDNEVPPEPLGQYDFGTATSPVETDYTRVTDATVYDAGVGYGWTTGTVSSRDRGIGTDLTRDLCYTTDATFEVDLADGTYEVSVTVGDTRYAHDQMGVIIEGTQVDEITTTSGETATGVYTVIVADGGLTVRLQDLGGTDAYATIIAIEIVDMSSPSNSVNLDGIVSDDGLSNSPAAVTLTWTD